MPVFEDRIKTEGVSVETSFSWELPVAMATTVLKQSVPKPKSCLFPIPLMIHIKLDQDWLHCNWSWRFHNKSIENLTSKFDEDPVKIERASLETPFSHYKSMPF